MQFRTILRQSRPTILLHYFVILICLLACGPGFRRLEAADPDFIPLFDGRTFTGWEGDTKTTWRIENGALVAGTLDTPQPRNEFLATARAYRDFELRLKWKLEGDRQKVNGGIQFRSRRIPGNHEMIGYQADLGSDVDGALYDESRRNRFLARPTDDVVKRAIKPTGEWNDYVIRAEGTRIQIWLNGVKTVDYVERDSDIDDKGVIAVQIHGGGPLVVRYKNIVLRDREQ
ncbi:MAG: DUF1080 domain-containing protein [Pirellulales bacterium]